MSAPSPPRGAPSRSPGATSARTPPAWRPARPGRCSARPDGIVDFTKSDCIGCKACMAACPYDAIFINPERPQRGEVQLLRPPSGHRPGTRLRERLPDPGDPDRRERRHRGRRERDRGPVSRSRCAGRRRAPGPRCSTAEPRRPPLTRWPRRHPPATSSPGPRNPRERTSSRVATRSPRTPAPPRSCPTTWLIAPRGTGGSASTPGPSPSPRAPTSWDCCWCCSARWDAATRSGCGRRRSSPPSSSP